MIAAKQYRTSANHLRPSPLQQPQFAGQDPTPMWDQVLYDDNEKILSTIDKVEREDERQARKARLARDQAEDEERLRLERLAADGEDGDASMAVDGGLGSGSVPGTPSGAKGAGETGKKEKKRKRETATQAARNMPEDVRKKLSDATASRKLGTKKYNWLAGGASGDSSPMRKKPKFPTLPPSSLSISTSLSGLATSGELPDSAMDSALPSGLGRLGGIPSAHDASRTGPAGDVVDSVVTIRDALFVMDKERGKGAGNGSGTRPMIRAMLGRV